jgi:hypothetical protein
MFYRSVFQDTEGKPIGRNALLERMREHIFTVAGRYKGRVHGWDVVNEALNEDGTLRKSQWFNILPNASPGTYQGLYWGAENDMPVSSATGILGSLRQRFKGRSPASYWERPRSGAFEETISNCQC